MQYLKVLKDYPPNIESIKEKLTLSGKEIFAWDGTIYNPSNGVLTTPLIEHEMVHFKQQNGKPEEWWNKYLSDIEFRVQQELEAHKMEYRSFCKENKDRNKQAKYLFEISRRLASPMYGNVMSIKEAMRKIKN